VLKTANKSNLKKARSCSTLVSTKERTISEEIRALPTKVRNISQEKIRTLGKWSHRGGSPPPLPTQEDGGTDMSPPSSALSRWSGGGTLHETSLQA